MKKTLAQINQLPIKDFVALLGNVVEHAPWVAHALAEKRPFAHLSALHEALQAAILARNEKVWVEILTAHPELSGKEASEGTLTEFSASEQGRLGLTSLSPENYRRIGDYNRRYRKLFGFPFVICVKHVADLTSLFAAMEKRLQHDRASEIRQGLQEVFEIAGVRLAQIISE